MTGLMASERMNGIDTAEPEEDRLQIVENLRETAMQRAMRMVAAAPNVFTRKDAEGIMEEYSEQGMRRLGYVTIDEQIASLRKLISHGIDDLERRSRETERKFRAAIEQDMGKRIGRRSVSRWMQRLAAENAYYWQKEQFVEDLSEKDESTDVLLENPKTLEGFRRNWRIVATRRQNMKTDPLFKSLSKNDVARLSMFKDDESFLQRPFDERLNLVCEVQAAIAAKKRQMPRLHDQAKSMLHAAVANKDLSPNKVGAWMNRIFQSGASADLIEQFISGSGGVIAGQKMTLGGMIANWHKASAHFMEIEKKREKRGTPRGFNFVKMNVFLGWDFERRKAYNQEADNRLEGLKGPDIFWQIRHEMDAGDWESAEYFMEKAENTYMLSDTEQNQLKSMRNYLNLHRTKDEKSKQSNQRRDPKEISKDLHSIIRNEIHPAEQETYTDACSGDFQRANAHFSCKYNRKWCHDHNFYDSAKEQEMEKEQKDPTRKRMKEGHKKRGMEVNVVKDDTTDSSAIRNQQDIRSAQVIFYDPRDANSRGVYLKELERQKHSKGFWYYVSVIPEGVPYNEDLRTIQTVHPRLKKLMRELHGQNARYTPPEREIATDKKEEKNQKKAPETVPSSLATPVHATKGAAEPQFASKA